MNKKKSSFEMTGTIKELMLLFFPILLMTFTNSLYFLVEKMFLARFSLEAMEAAVNAAYASQIIQAPCIGLALMAQVFVGRWYGAREWHEIGPGIWQFIWFSVLSMFFTVPFSLVYGYFYFQGTNLEEIVMPYFYFLVFSNFTYPLASALSCFFLGQGKTKLVLIMTVLVQCIKLLLAYLLIFGIPRWLPALGLLGGAISTLVAQVSYCAVLMAVFLNKKHLELFDSHRWQFKIKQFWECIQPGFLRAIARIFMVASWASIAHLMTSKGGDFLLVISIGGTLFLFLPFLGDAIGQAQVTIVSNILGSRNYADLDRAFRSACWLVLIVVIAMGVPLLLFPFPTLHFLFPKVLLEGGSVRQLFFGVWSSFVCFTFCFVPLSYVLAAKDTKFLLLIALFNWVNGFLLMYFAIEIVNIHADQFWLVLSVMHASTGLLYLWRMYFLRNRLLQTVTLQTRSGF